MIGSLAKFLGGNVISKGFDFLNKREALKNDKYRIDVDLNKKQMETALADRQSAREVSKTFIGIRLFQIPIAILLAGFVVHILAVVFVSTFPKFGWKVEDLPTQIQAIRSDFMQLVTGFGAASVGGLTLMNRWKK